MNNKTIELTWLRQACVLDSVPSSVGEYFVWNQINMDGIFNQKLEKIKKLAFQFPDSF